VFQRGFVGRPRTGLVWLGWADKEDPSKIYDLSHVGSQINCIRLQVSGIPEIERRGGADVVDYDAGVADGRYNSGEEVAGSKLDIQTGTMSIEAWIERDIGAADGRDRRLLGATASNEDADTYKLMIGGRNAAANDEAGMRITTPTFFSSSVDTGSDTTFEGGPHHVVATLDTALASERLKLYVDGVLIGTDDTISQGVTMEAADADTEFVFGSANSVQGRPWDGKIWKGSQYSVTLTAAQVLDLFKLGHGKEERRRFWSG